MLYRIFTNKMFFFVNNDVSSWVICPHKASRINKAGDFLSNRNSLFCDSKYETSVFFITLTDPSVFGKCFGLALNQKKDGKPTNGILLVVFPSQINCMDRSLPSEVTTNVAAINRLSPEPKISTLAIPFPTIV